MADEWEKAIQVQPEAAESLEEILRYAKTMTEAGRRVVVHFRGVTRTRYQFRLTKDTDVAELLRAFQDGTGPETVIGP